MGDIILETAGTLLFFFLTVYLWNFGRKCTDISRNGWKIVVTGFMLISMGHFVDLLGDYPLTETYVDDNQVEFIFEELVGEFMGYLVLAVGMSRWMPTVASAERVQSEIAERKKAEASLMEKTSLLSGLLNSIPEGVYFKEKDGKYLGCNRAFLECVKCPAREIIGKTDFDLFPKEMSDLTSGRDREVIESGNISTYEDRMPLPDGSAMTIESLRAPLYLENGEFVGLLGISRDITEHKKAEDALLKARLAEDANRAKSEFLATMSHELRTPLNSIIGFSDVLLECTFGELNERQTRYLNNISSSGKHLNSLINDILDLSKVEAGKMALEIKPFDVEEALEEIRKEISPLALKKQISLKLRVEGQLPALEADRTKFRQILDNLLSNAIKFTPEGGKVTVSALKENELLRFRVDDTGIGISKENQEELFQAFKQLESFTNRRYEGTGLGLFLIRKFVEMHGGSIRVESEEGKGASFIFELPLKREEP